MRTEVMIMQKKLLKNATVLTLNKKDEILTNTDILIDGDEIVKIEKNIKT